jgi:hypothetical protein
MSKTFAKEIYVCVGGSQQPRIRMTGSFPYLFPLVQSILLSYEYLSLIYFVLK